MRLFNAFQITCLFVGMPWICQYLDSASFTGHQIALYTAYVVYVIMFGFVTAAICNMVEKL